MHRHVPRHAAAIGAVGLAVAVALPGLRSATATASTAAAPVGITAQRTPSVVYGTAARSAVTVYRQALPAGSPETLFTYDNPDTSDEVDNQAVNAPELALSPDGQAVAYFARSGLRVRHLDTGDDDEIIGITGHHARGENPDSPIWTAPELNPPPDEDPEGAYTAGMISIGDIAFSPDGRYLSFAGYWYEYADHWVVDLATGQRWRDQGSSDLAWSPASDRVAVAGPSYADPGPLALSAPSDFGRYATIKPVPDTNPDLSYERLAFAPDGDHIAFTTLDRSKLSAQAELGTSKVDGTGYSKVAAISATAPFVYGDEATLYTVEGRDRGPYLLVAHDLAEGTSRAVATVPDVLNPVELWLTPARDLAVVAATNDPGEGSFQQRLFLYSSDGRLLQTSPSYSSFTRMIGLTFA